MTFSRAVLGTNKNKVKMSWMYYIFTHLIPTWGQSFNSNFRMWRDLITDDYDKYTLLEEDTPFEECYNWFWTSINLDETYPKEFLEDLMQMVEDVETGVVETIPADEVFRTLRELAQEDTTDPS